MRWAPIGTAGILAGILAGCGPGLGPYGRPSELTSATLPGDSIRVIVVVAGEPDVNDRQLAARVIQRLRQAGITALARPGLWESEQAALADICPTPDPGEVDGILFVWWNQLDLRHCPSHARAFQIHGAYRGVDYMVGRLLRYLRVETAS